MVEIKQHEFNDSMIGKQFFLRKNARGKPIHVTCIKHNSKFYFAGENPKLNDYCPVYNVQGFSYAYELYFSDKIFEDPNHSKIHEIW